MAMLTSRRIDQARNARYTLPESWCGDATRREKTMRITHNYTRQDRLRGRHDESARALVEAAAEKAASLRGACLVGLDLRRLRLPPGTDLSHANFNRADLSGAVLDGCILDGALFAGAELSGMSAREASAVRADFERASAQSVDFEGAHLSAARFDGADLAHAIFRGARCDGASFWRTWLLGADLVDADMSAALLADAVDYGSKAVFEDEGAA
jgi:uncharacterized protein YjbI with pentapeptide repeats